ncbi:MAG: hypothetical protein LBP58_07675 [Azoarcus sp.]|nr:hypothetical protein [Azoarcus sp.]
MAFDAFLKPGCRVAGLLCLALLALTSSAPFAQEKTKVELEPDQTSILTVPDAFSNGYTKKPTEYFCQWPWFETGGFLAFFLEQG